MSDRYQSDDGALGGKLSSGEEIFHELVDDTMVGHYGAVVVVNWRRVAAQRVQPLVEDFE